mmetsp:Transcript_21938/g.44382  ORF Transcript_21938/g.44382 Transcript_21938/m.44382 type:complete len:172 (-) Transcript_21938:236-751(-)
MDKEYLKRWNEVKRTAGEGRFRLYGICSQKQNLASQTARKWKLTSFDEVLGDPTNEFVKHLKSSPELLPEIVVTDCSKVNHPYLKLKNYPFGAVQASIFFFVGQRPVLGWCKRPSARNLEGALTRPDPVAAWGEICHMRDALRQKETMVSMSDGKDLPVVMTCRSFFCSVL